jgi:hypothetical protein
MGAALALSTGGCYAIHYESRLPPGGPQHEERVNYFLWGFVGEKDVDLDALCPQGVHAFRSEATITNGLLFAITLGIWAPRTVVVECAGK